MFENSCEYSMIMFIGIIEFLIRNIKLNWDKKKYFFVLSKFISINFSLMMLEIGDK